MDFFNTKKQIDKKVEPTVTVEALPPDNPFTEKYEPARIVEDTKRIEEAPVPAYIKAAEPPPGLPAVGGLLGMSYRQFSSGATRDVVDGKLHLTGFFSVPAQRAFADYMHLKRQMPDGSLRDGDNWQKGMPRRTLLEGLERHFFDVKARMTGQEKFAITEDDLKTALCAVMFNAQALLHEIQIERDLQS